MLDVSHLIFRELGESPQNGTFALAELVARLEGVTLIRPQLIALTNITAAVRIFDGAYDDVDLVNGYQNAALIEGYLNSGVGSNLLDERLGRAMKIACDNPSGTALMTLGDLALAQRDSLLQRQAIGRERVAEITRNKALTFLLFALTVNPGIDEEQKKCYKELGYLIQLIDDFRDRDDDLLDGISTLATLPNTNITPIILKQSKFVIQIFRKVYGSKKTREIFRYIKVTLARVGFVF